MTQKSALELGREIATGKLDPVELTQETFEKIDASGIGDKVFARLTKDRALQEAKAVHARQKGGTVASPLDGVPISWKDLFDTKGIATESGSQLLTGRTPNTDCEILKRATAAGTICIGKTHLSELAFSGLGINPKTETAPNIHGDHLAPGGSSSGAAASIAFGFVPIGVGSDTGGSVRIPAAWNDLVGLKTTHGLLPDDGIVPLCSGFDTAGPLSRTIEDAWVMTQIFANGSTEVPQAKPISEYKFFVNETIVLDDLGDDQREGFELAVEALQRAGAGIVRGPIHECSDIVPLGPVLFPYEAWRQWGEAIQAQPDLMFEPVRERFKSGMNLTQEQYKFACSEMLSLRESYYKRTSPYDAVLAPTIPIAPPEITPLLEDYELFSATNMMALRNTRFLNMFGTCALTIPTSKPASGLMIAGKPFGEAELVSMGLSIQSAIQ